MYVRCMQAGMAEAARVRLEARLAQLARTEPEVLNSLIQEQACRMH